MMVPVEDFKLFYENFLHNFQVMDGNRFIILDPENDLAKDWVIEYNIWDYGDVYDLWKIEFVIYHGEVEISRFTLDSDLWELRDEFYVKLLDIQDQYSVCPHCKCGYTLKMVSGQDSCPHCGEDLNVEEEGTHCSSCGEYVVIDGEITLYTMCPNCGDFLD